MKDDRRVHDGVIEACADHNQVEQQIGTDQEHGETDRFGEAFKKNRTQQDHQYQGEAYCVLPKTGRYEWILEDMGRRICRGQGDGDHEIGRDETEQAEDKQLTLPPGQQVLEHGY
jgi:hypothetical protein